MIFSSKQYRSYIATWLLVLLSLLFLAGIFNYYVDPYGLFGTERVVGFNRIKPTASDHVRLSKPYQVKQIQPKTIIAGNSRPEMGLNPDNACWPDQMRPVYNMGIPGASVYMALRNVQHAISSSDVKYVFWGLDFKDFISASNSNTQHWPPERKKFEQRLVVNADGGTNTNYRWNVLKDQFESTLSLNALSDSFYTVYSQSNKKSQTIRHNGFNPAFDMKEIMKLEGQGLIFKQKNIEVTELFSHQDWTVFSGKGRWSDEFEDVSRFLKYAAEQEVRVVLFINPYHADYLVTMEAGGWWSQFDAWKRQLMLLSEKYKVELWDFSVINSFSTEQPPALGDTNTILEWFWEPAHYRKEYGDLMLSGMLRRGCHVGDVEQPGVVLTTGNIDNHLYRSEQAMSAFLSRRKNPSN